MERDAAAAAGDEIAVVAGRLVFAVVVVAVAHRRMSSALPY